MREIGRLAVMAAALLFPASLSMAYPGGTPQYVTDVAPFCTSCHSSVSAAQLAGVPEKRVEKELAANKHIAEILQALEGSAYHGLTETERQELVRGIEAIDAASRVRLNAPTRIKVGQVFEVMVAAIGGAGPVIGLSLVDAAHRWQARPAPSVGWRIVAAPRILGPDGKEQTQFIDGRVAGLSPAISYVNVYGVSADPGRGRYDSVTVTFRLQAPATPGSYPLVAAFLYGTEKASPHGAVQEVWGVRPLGGFTGHSGRVRFSEPLQIEVE